MACYKLFVYGKHFNLYSNFIFYWFGILSYKIGCMIYHWALLQWRCFQKGIFLMLCKVGAYLATNQSQNSRGDTPKKGTTQKLKFSNLQILTKSHMGSWPYWGQIWPCFWTMPTSSLWFWLCLSKELEWSNSLVCQKLKKNDKKLVDHISFKYAADVIILFDRKSTDNETRLLLTDIYTTLDRDLQSFITHCVKQDTL